MFRIENLLHWKSVSQEVHSTVFRCAPMMRCHQQKKTDRERTKIRNKWFCRVGRLDRQPLPRLISPRVGILARTRTYVLPSQACVNKSVTTMNGFRDNAYLCIFCLKKYSKYVKTRCNFGLDKKMYTTLSQSWWMTKITTKSLLWKFVVSYLRSVTRIATSLRLPHAYHSSKLLKTKTVKNVTCFLLQYKKVDNLLDFTVTRTVHIWYPNKLSAIHYSMLVHDDPLTQTH